MADTGSPTCRAIVVIKHVDLCQNVDCEYCRLCKCRVNVLSRIRASAFRDEV